MCSFNKCERFSENWTGILNDLKLSICNAKRSFQNIWYAYIFYIHINLNIQHLVNSFEHSVDIYDVTPQISRQDKRSRIEPQNLQIAPCKKRIILYRIRHDCMQVYLCEWQIILCLQKTWTTMPHCKVIHVVTRATSLTWEKSSNQYTLMSKTMVIQ